METYYLKSRRRSFLGAALISLAALCLPYEAGAANASEPEKGGTLTFNFQSDPPNFDPLSNSTSRTLYAIAPCYNSLIKFDPMDPKKIVGDLAKSWVVSPDGKEIVFKIVDNAHFHDGHPLTSADVKFTFDRIRNPPEGVVSVRKSALAAVDEITTPDDYTVIFKLKQPSPSLLTNLATGWMLIIPKHFVEGGGDLKKTVMGSGPFKFASYQTGVSVNLVRNPDYHVSDRPYLDGITFYIVPDPATVYGYFRTGQIHVYESLQGEDGRRAEKEFGDKILVQGTPSYGFSSLVFNATKAPWNDPRVRQALDLAIDRREALKVLRQNDGYLGGLMPAEGVWSLSQEELASLPGFGTDRAADLTKARKLLEEAGFADGLEAKLMTKRGASYEALGVFLTAQLAEVGVKASLDLQEDASAYDNLTSHKFEIAAWEQTVNADDPDAVLGELYTCDGGRNFSGICDKKVDDLFQKQTVELDQAKRHQLVKELELSAMSNLDRVVLFWRKSFLGQSRRVHDLLRHPQMDNNRRMEDVWLSSE
ncbi:ABC transporter substrate-binding protein [Ensifer sp. YR511]|uniref:ABC transporter substrate-binding protein n=1 Tax=Ensifer sp. YR511 TaxID=1855294 RepID=UPI000888F20B|nr:ABC transporter substrate-binding protein [Ensifer sp. YR511]SDN73319.1 peptide/nickel transport system substrate-binding protein [Ensifer sp. YR511]